jgi:signal peptidase I
MKPGEQVESAITCGLAGEVVRTFGNIRLRVFGTSMVPSVLPGDLISVQRANVSEISLGEIVLYVREGRMFVHRVVGCKGSPENSHLITRGDCLRHNDPPISSSELLGRVISIERGNCQWRPTLELSTRERMIVTLFRNSSHATYLYLRLAALRQGEARYSAPLLGGANERQQFAGSVK